MRIQEKSILSWAGIILLAISISNFSCKKDEKVFFPSIVVNVPQENTIYQIGDTVHIDADLSSEDGLVNGRVSIVDNNFINVSNALSFNLNGNSFKLNASIELSNIQLVTGTYYVSIQVNGNSEDAIAYRKILIQGIPKIRKGFIAVTETNPGYSTWQLENNGSQLLRSSVADEFCCLEMNARFDLVYTCPTTTGTLKALDSDDFSEKWSVPAMAAGGNPYFRGINYDSELLFVSYQDRTIRGFDFAGTSKFLTQTKENTYPERTKVFNGYVFAEQHDLAGSGVKIAVFVLSSGVGWQSVDINIDIIDFFQKSATEYYVIGNLNGEGKIYEYNFTTNTLFLQKTLNGDSIKAVSEISSSNFLLATQTAVHSYDATSNLLGTWHPNNNVVCLDYDEVNDQVAVGSGTTIQVFPYQNPGAAVINYVLSQPVHSVKAIFNRE